MSTPIGSITQPVTPLFSPQAFTNATVLGFDRARKIDQFDFGYLGGQQLDLLLLAAGVHFTYYDPPEYRELLDTFLPAVHGAAGNQPTPTHRL